MYVCQYIYFGNNVPFCVVYRPVLFGYVHSHHLQRLQTLDHPAVPFADTRRLHVEEGVGHAAPQDGHDGLHVQAWRALWDWIPVLALEHGR